MFMRMQDSDFAQIQSNLLKSNYKLHKFCPNFAQIYNQICPYLINFNNKIFAN